MLLFYRSKGDRVGDNMSHKNPDFVTQLEKNLKLAQSDVAASTSANAWRIPRGMYASRLQSRSIAAHPGLRAAVATYVAALAKNAPRRSAQRSATKQYSFSRQRRQACA